MHFQVLVGSARRFADNLYNNKHILTVRVLGVVSNTCPVMDYSQSPIPAGSIEDVEFLVVYRSATSGARVTAILRVRLVLEERDHTAATSTSKHKRWGCNPVSVRLTKVEEPTLVAMDTGGSMMFGVSNRG